MLELAALPGGLGSPIGRTGRSAFGSRLDLLARRFSAEPTFPLTFADPVAPGFEGIEPRLAQSYSVLLRVIHGDSSFERSIQRPRAHLAALIARLANAMHVAPALGYGTNTRTGAMLRVRA